MSDPRSKRRHLAALLLPVCAAVLVAGCSLLPWASPTPEPVNPELPVGVKVVTPPGAMQVHVSNGTTMAVTVTVNDAFSRAIEPGQGADLTAADLGGPPWVVKVRTSSGRVLVELTVRAGDVWQQRNPDGSTTAQGAGARVDLSCGRIDITSGVFMSGPAPGPGAPGDCDP